MEEYEVKSYTGIDTISIKIDKYSKEDTEIIYNNFINMFKNNETRVMDDKKTNGKVVWYTNKRILIISKGVYAIKDLITKEFVKKYYINIKFIGMTRRIEYVDDMSFKCLEHVFGNLNLFKIEYKINALDIFTGIAMSMDNLLVLCNNKLSNTKYHPLDTKFYGGDTVYIENILPHRVNEHVRRAYMYNKAKKENIREEITRFEIKMQKPYFVNREPTLINI